MLDFNMQIWIFLTAKEGKSGHQLENVKPLYG